MQIIDETLFHDSATLLRSEIWPFSYFPGLSSKVCLTHTQRPRFPDPAIHHLTFMRALVAGIPCTTHFFFRG
jgi:hypothetical protein